MQNSFGELFKKYRLKAEIPTLSKFGQLLAEKGFNYEDSIFSHWQNGNRVPQYRILLLKLLEVFVERKAVISISEANSFLESANQGNLSGGELKKFKFADSILTPFQIPGQIANFTGRQAIIAKLKKQAKENKIILLSGPPGVGKTSLAIKVGYLLRKEFPDGVLWFRLDTSDVMDILLAIAYTFGKDVSNILDREIRASTVRSVLVNKRVLLIFDNAEPKTEISLLLPNNKNCLVIINSRDSVIDISNDYKSIIVPEFNREETLDLFKEVLGENYLTKHKSEIFELADLVGNLPLALNIFAQEIKRGSISIGDLKSRIDQDPAYLAGLTYENRNLSIALEISFNLLDEQAKKVFISLGVFNGKDFSVEAVAFINDSTDAFSKKILSHLKQTSLIEESLGTRYRIHPVIKKFIQKKLDNPKLFLKASRYYQNFLAKYDKKDLKSKPYMKQEGDNVLYIFKKCYEFAFWDEIIALWNPLEQLLNETKQLNKMRDVYRIVKTKKSGLNIFQKILLAYISFLMIYWILLNFTGLRTVFLGHLTSLFLTIMTLFGGITGIFIAKSWGLFKSLVGKSLLFISIGLLSWSAGSIIWSYYNFFLNNLVPYPSWADLGYLSSYIFWTIGIIHLPHAIGKKSYLQKKYSKLLFLIPVFVITLSYYLVVFITKSSLVFSPVSSAAKLFFDVAYPLADAIILTVALFIGISFKFMGGKYKLSIYSFMLGFLSFYIADFMFSYTTTVGIFREGGFVDLFFIVGFFLLTFGTLGFYFKPEKEIK